MERSAARHQTTTTTTTTTSSSSSSKHGQFTFVSFPAPFKSIKDELSSSLSIKQLASVSPLAIMRGLQRTFKKPCEALFANATALQVKPLWRIRRMSTLSTTAGCAMHQRIDP
jgi:hypothetical protein